MQKKFKIDIVYFNPEGDGVTAIYIDGELYKWGDYYHDKIDDWCRGFLDALIFADINFTSTTTNISYEDNHDLVEDIVESGGSPPELFKELGV